MAWPGTDRRPSDAESGEFIPQVWSARVINHVRSYLVSAQLVNTTWKDQMAMGDKVWIPVMTELSTYDVNPTVTTALPTSVNTSLGTAAVYITIDHWKEAPIIVDDSVKRQTQVGNILEIGADNAAYAIEKAIDTQACALFSGLGGYSSTAYGADGQTFTDDILIVLMETLDEADVPSDNRALVGDPSTLGDCFKIDKFMSYDYSKNPLGQGAPIAGTGGYRGTIVPYQLPLYITNHLAGASVGNFGCLLHRNAIGLVIQSGPDVEKWRHHAGHADVVNISAMWGEDELINAFGIPFYTRLT